MLSKLREFLYRNVKRDYYQVRLRGVKQNNLLFNFYVKVNFKKGIYPSRRLIAKLYGTEIFKHIRKYPANRGCKIDIDIISKIGSFRPKGVQ